MAHHHTLRSLLAAGITFVQYANSAALTGQTTATVTLASAPASGDLVVVSIGAYNNASPTVSSSGATWKQVAPFSQASVISHFLFFSTNCTTAAITVAFGGSTNYAFTISHYTGAHASTPVDMAYYAGSGTTVTSSTLPSLTPAFANELIVSGINAPASITTTPSGYTTDPSISYYSGQFTEQVAYLVQAGAATTNPVWTFPSGGYASTVAAFRKAGAYTVPPGAWTQFGDIVPSSYVTQLAYDASNTLVAVVANANKFATWNATTHAETEIAPSSYGISSSTLGQGRMILNSGGNLIMSLNYYDSGTATTTYSVAIFSQVGAQIASIGSPQGSGLDYPFVIGPDGYLWMVNGTALNRYNASTLASVGVGATALSTPATGAGGLHGATNPGNGYLYYLTNNGYIVRVGTGAGGTTLGAKTLVGTQLSGWANGGNPCIISGPDGAGGTVLWVVGGSSTSCIWRMTFAGVQNTFCNSVTPILLGSSQFTLNSPTCPVFGADGMLYVAQTGTNGVAKVDPTSPWGPTTVNITNPADTAARPYSIVAGADGASMIVSSGTSVQRTYQLGVNPAAVPVGGSNPAFVQYNGISVTSPVGGTTYTLTLGSAPSAANTLVIGVTNFSSADDLRNNLLTVKNGTTTIPMAYMSTTLTSSQSGTVAWYIATGMTSTSITVQFTNTANGTGIFAYEFTNINANPLDTRSASSTASTTSGSSGSITPNYNNEVLIAVHAGTFSPNGTPSGYTAQAALGLGGTYAMAAHQIQTTAAASNPTWTTASSGNMFEAVLALKPL